MAEKKITDLPESSHILESDFVEFVDTNSNTSKKITLENVAKSISHGDLGGLTTANDHPQYLLAATGKAADSDKLDGKDSTDFSLATHNHDTAYLGISAKAADSDKLDGVDSSGYVNTTGTQTIAGTKTFSSIPILPSSDPTNANEAVRKAYVDSKIVPSHKQLWIGGWKPYLTGGCANPAQIEMGTNKNVYDYLAFDKDTVEKAYANVPMPDDYSGGAIKAKPYWLHPATTTNFKVSWSLAGVAFGNDDSLDAAAGTAQYSNDVGGTTNDLYIGETTAAITLAGAPTAGDLVQFTCLRKADDTTNDTLAVDAYLLGWMIWYPVG